MPDKLMTAFSVHEYSANLKSMLNTDLDSLDSCSRDVLRRVAKHTAIAAEMIRYTEWFLKQTITEEEYHRMIERLEKGKLDNA